MIRSSKMFQLTRLPFELTRDFSILMYSACPGTSNFVQFSAMFELNHSRINAIPLYYKINMTGASYNNNINNITILCEYYYIFQVHTSWQISIHLSRIPNHLVSFEVSHFQNEVPFVVEVIKQLTMIQKIETIELNVCSHLD